MNSFGRIFRIHIFGESHGESVGVVIDGCPAGIAINENDFVIDIQRRQGGNTAGTTPRKEADMPLFKSGIFNGYTTGAPITILFENNNTKSKDYDKIKDIPRPGHADYVAHKKFNGFNDYRGGGHFSGRLTLPLVAAGVIAKKIVEQKIIASVINIAGESDVEKGLQKALDNNDSVGGVVECKVESLPVGLGEPFFDSIESVISHIVFSIPAIKGIEFGSGFNAVNMFGSENNDAILNHKGETKTNNAGGVNGGLTNGNELVFRVAVKPASSTPKEQQSYNKVTGEIEKFSVEGRHDLCIALRVPPVLEAVTAIVLADLKMLYK